MRVGYLFFDESIDKTLLMYSTFAADYSNNTWILMLQDPKPNGMAAARELKMTLVITDQ